jgi:hypothetical protein
MTDEQKIKNALLAIDELSGYDGAHHKQWAIDQILRALLGCQKIENEYGFQHFGTNDAYKNWVGFYESGADGPFTYEWDAGVAP